MKVSPMRFIRRNLFPAENLDYAFKYFSRQKFRAGHATPADAIRSIFNNVFDQNWFIRGLLKFIFVSRHF
jgi:hypothetical protein